WDDYLTQLPNAAARVQEVNVHQRAADKFRTQLLSSFSGTLLTIVPTFFEPGVSVVNPQSMNNTGTISLREKLFGYKTVNFLNPWKIYTEQFGEFYPLALQDYRLSFTQSQDFSQLIAHNQSVEFSQDVSIAGITGGDSTIYVRSRNSENQDNKVLDRISYLYPEVVRFTQITPAANDIVVRCVCGNPIPEYFFIYLERIETSMDGKYENEPPKVSGLSIKRNGQQIRIYNETKLSQYDLHDITRRNSHPRADMKQLYEEFGGVLINRYDLGTLLEEQQLGTYLLDLEFTIEMENEPNNEPFASTEANLLNNLDKLHANQTAVTARLVALSANQTTVGARVTQLSLNQTAIAASQQLQANPAFVIPAAVGALAPPLVPVAPYQMPHADPDIRGIENDLGEYVNIRYNARVQLDTRATVLFLYNDGSHLKGDSSKMEFVKRIF
ncbi:MAG: hypothetical protein VX289_05435, partial [Candidatus Poribacteria bacterium]|nr:hypothetical protein [Candidatus Poribacteria bacterium]